MKNEICSVSNSLSLPVANFNVPCLSSVSIFIVMLRPSFHVSFFAVFLQCLFPGTLIDVSDSLCHFSFSLSELLFFTCFTFARSFVHSLHCFTFPFGVCFLSLNCFILPSETYSQRGCFLQDFIGQYCGGISVKLNGRAGGKPSTCFNQS